MPCDNKHNTSINNTIDFLARIKSVTSKRCKPSAVDFLINLTPSMNDITRQFSTGQGRDGGVGGALGDALKHDCVLGKAGSVD